MKHVITKLFATPYSRLLLLFLFALTCTSQAYAQATRYSVYEIPLTSTSTFSNPYTGVTLNATFTGPGGITKTVKGFWDGGNTFKVRFTPTVTGTWSYSISSSPADSGLTRSGSITVTAPVSGKHGFLRRDPSYPYSFMYDDGTRYFMLGQTYYEIMRLVMAGGAWKTSIDNTKLQGMNKIRMVLYPFNSGGITTLPQILPYQGTVGSPNRDQLNLAFWQKYDEVLKYIDSKGMIADVILFDYGNAFGTQAQDERFVRYALSRYAAYPNVIFTLCNEWELGPKPMSYWDAIGTIVRNENPWQSEGTAQRPLSIHRGNGRDFEYFSSSWPVHAIIQYTIFDCNFRTPSVDANSSAAILQNMGHNMPVVNDEIGYVNGTSWCQPAITRSEYRNIMWAIITAGGYLAHGDANQVNGNYIDMSGEWLYLPGFHDDIKRIADYFTTRGLEYWKMSSQNGLRTSGSRVYVLGKSGLGYVAYAAVGGAFALNLPAGNYSVEWFNPSSGAVTTQATVSGGSRSFTPPFSGDAVLRLDIQGTVQTFTNKNLAAVGKCLTATGTTPQSNVVIDQCDGRALQQWSYTISKELRNGSLCLDVAAASTANGGNVQVYTCNSANNQKWERVGSAFKPLHVSGLTMCMDVTGGSSTNGTNVQIYTCNSSSAQNWMAQDPPSVQAPSPPSGLRITL